MTEPGGNTPDRVFTAYWTTVPDRPSISLTGHTTTVKAITAVALRDGRTLLATAGYDETVRLWDPTTGQAVGEPLTGHTDTVNAITAVALPDGRTLLATGSEDNTVRLWDPTTGQAVGEPLTGHTGMVCAITAVTLRDGRTLLATAGYDRTVRLWDPTTGHAVGVLHLPYPARALTGLPTGLLALGYGNETAVLTLHPTTEQEPSTAPADG